MVLFNGLLSWAVSDMIGGCGSYEYNSRLATVAKRDKLLERTQPCGNKKT